MTTTADLQTPALVVDAKAFELNLRTMSRVLPGPKLRPHVKAHKTSAIARRQAEAGHRSFTCATIREVEVLAGEGLTDDLLLANEVVNAERLGAVARAGARVTLAVDSEATIEAAARGGVEEVLIDVNVGMPRCGCRPADAGRLADLARAKGLNVRGVMGYEGHIVGLPSRDERTSKIVDSMARLITAHEQVGGDVISAGGTGTFDINHWATEIQAGSYILMDTSYGQLELPFRQALTVLATVISSNPKWTVADCGLKALGMDHGNPTIEGATVLYCADEHVIFVPEEPVAVGDRIEVVPAHIDPTIAYHDRMHVVRDDEVIDVWSVDMRGW